MAEVSYKGQQPKEPKVNVTGIPQSEYEGNAATGGGGGGGGGLGESFKKHKWLWIAGGAGVIILFILWYNNRVSTGGTTGTTTDTSGTAGLSGSQADANYQQLQSTEDVNTALLQSILNQLGGNQPGSNPTNPPIPPNPPAGNPPLQGNPPVGGTPYGTPPMNPWTPWVTQAQGARFSQQLAQKGQAPFLSNIYAGETFQYEGLWTTLVPGSQGRVWEVPGRMSAQQALNTPIGPGQKQLLYQR